MANVTNISYFDENNLISVKDYPEFRASKLILLYVPPLVLLVGTFGNLFSFFILRQSMNKISTYFYLAILALTDILVLFIGLLRLWIGEITGFDIRDGSDVICKGVITLGYIFSDFSVWLIVAVTTERYIAVCFPLKASFMCDVKQSRITTAVLFLFTIFLNCHFLWTVEVSREPNHNSTSMTSHCQATPDFRYLLDVVWPWVDAAIYSLVPSVVMTILNILIIRQVIRARHLRMTLQSGKTTCTCLQTNRNRKRCKCDKSRTPNESSLKLTSMLLVVSFSFILTTSPNNVGVIVKTCMIDITHQGAAQLYLAVTVTEMLMYLNHSINFFLYCATGGRFRRSIKRIVCRLKNRRPLDQGHGELMTKYTLMGGRSHTQYTTSYQNSSDTIGQSLTQL